MTDKLNLQRLDSDPRLPMRGSIDFERVLYVRLYELFRAIAGVVNQNDQALSEAIQSTIQTLTENIRDATNGLATSDEVNQAIAGVVNQIGDFENGLGSAAYVDVVGLTSNGAIIESGSNNNGYYVKYADGTMICMGGGYTISGNYAEVDITMASEFKKLDHYQICSSSKSGDDYTTYIIKNEPREGLYFTGSRSLVRGRAIMGDGSLSSPLIRTELYVSYLAAGRWK